jgi:hypothetical protein
MQNKITYSDKLIKEKEIKILRLNKLLKDYESKFIVDKNKSNDILNLNIGGQLYDIKRSTLALENSILSSQFSG